MKTTYFLSYSTELELLGVSLIFSQTSSWTLKFQVSILFSIFDVVLHSGKSEKQEKRIFCFPFLKNQKVRWPFKVLHFHTTKFWVNFGMGELVISRLHAAPLLLSLATSTWEFFCRFGLFVTFFLIFIINFCNVIIISPP